MTVNLHSKNNKQTCTRKKNISQRPNIVLFYFYLTLLTRTSIEKSSSVPFCTLKTIKRDNFKRTYRADQAQLLLPETRWGKPGG
jgi:hypothetical protein